VLLTCPIVDPAHVLLGHVAPVALLGLGAAAFGARRR
jgi:MYXO-CTERM domain-containing protein